MSTRNRCFTAVGVATRFVGYCVAESLKEKLSRIIVVSALLSSTVFAATRIDLNSNWLFRTDPNLNGEAAGWTRLRAPRQ